MDMLRGRRKHFLSLLLSFWCVCAFASAQDVQLKNNQSSTSLNLFPNGFQVEVSDLVRSMHAELMSSESQLEQVAGERDALYVINAKLQKEVTSLKRKNSSRFRTGFLLGAAASAIVTGVVCCACLTVALK